MARNCRIETQGARTKTGNSAVNGCVCSCYKVVFATGGYKQRIRRIDVAIPEFFSQKFKRLVVALISFALFGIEQIGIEIEERFGRNPHGLPLDEMCNTMRQNIEGLSRFATDSAYAPTQIF